MSEAKLASFAPTPLVSRGGATGRRLLDLSIGNPGPPAGARIALRSDGEADLDLGSVPTGTSTRRVAMPGRHGRLEYRLLVGEREQQGAVEVPPVRSWRISLVHFSHHDIGYTDLPEVAERQQLEYLDAAVRYCAETSGYPVEARFRWTLDTTWPLVRWLATRDRRTTRRFRALVREGRIEVTALFVAFNAGLPDHEELIRSVAFACRLRRHLHIPVSSAMSTDVPGHPWALASILPACGIRYLSTSVNAQYEQAGRPRAREPVLPKPFFWMGPHGGEVLVWNTGPGANYGTEGRDLGFYEDIAAVEHKLPAGLAALEASAWPYELASFRVGTDNRAPDRSLADVVREWNARYLSPTLVMDTAGGFLAELERRAGGRFARTGGDWTDWWLDGPASSAGETALARRAREGLLAAGTLAAMAVLADAAAGVRRRWQPPLAGLTAAYDRLMLYDEHTWGMWDNVLAPDAPDTRHHWLAKATHAFAAERSARELTDTCARALADAICPPSAQPTRTGGPGALPGSDLLDGAAPKPITLLVLNPCSWQRTEPVLATVPDSLAGAPVDAPSFRLVERATGREVAFQRWSRTEHWTWRRETTVAFVAADVPGFGWRAYDLVPSPGGLAGASAARVGSPLGDGLDNGNLRLAFCKRSGGIRSLLDARLGAELVDPGAGYTLGQLIHDRGEPPANVRSSSTFVSLGQPESGPVFSRLASESRGEDLPRIRTEAVLWEGACRLDLSLALDKFDTLAKEGIYVAFPLAVPGGAFTLEIAGTTMRPGDDQLPGSCADWHAAQRWLDVSGPRFGVTWATRDGGVVSLGSIRTGRLAARFEAEGSSFFAYVMNNAWDTNFKESQGGRLAFRFSLAPHAGPLEPVAATSFGAAVCAPMIVRSLPSAPDRGSDRGSLLEVHGEGTVAPSLKPAEDGRGIVVRLRETSGRAATVELGASGLELAGGWETSPVEDDGRRLEVRAGRVRVELPAGGAASVRLVVGG